MAAIKGFWRDNGRFIFAAVLVIALGFGGYQGYQAYAAHQGEKASRLLTEFEQAIAEQNATKAEAPCRKPCSRPRGQHAPCPGSHAYGEVSGGRWQS